MAEDSRSRAGRRLWSANVILTVVIVVLAAAVIGGIVLFGGDGEDSDGTADAGTEVPEQVLAPSGSHAVVDGPDGGVTVVEFLDYQCPACAAFYDNITRELEQDYQGRITFVVRNFPLDSHPLAEPAARAAEAAGTLGEFNAMYHALYDNYASWALADDGKSLSDDRQRAEREFVKYAEDIGLDTDDFRTAMDSEEVAQTIADGRADGQRAGVEGTPTLFVDGVRFEPAGDSFDAVEQQLRAEIEERLGA